MISKVIGENIRLHRTLKGLGQKNIAVELNKSQNWVQGIESGRINISPEDETPKKIANLLEVDVASLIQEKNQSFINCKNSGNHNTYNISNDLNEIKSLMRELIETMKR